MRPRHLARCVIALHAAKSSRVRDALTPQIRRKKDKNAPKRPRNAYLIFLDRHRPDMQKENPSMAMKELTRILAARWQNVSPAERAECDRLALENKVRARNACATSSVHTTLSHV